MCEYTFFLGELQNATKKNLQDNYYYTYSFISILVKNICSFFIKNLEEIKTYIF